MEQSKSRDIIRKAFSIHGDSASHEEIKQRILSGGEVRGTNLCVLVLAIFIASIGLNMNSTAVIIGAMLISPLMGCIMAIGYGLSTGNLIQARNSALGLFFQVIICLITSCLYFSISPITTASSELLARTSPTIWDVLIACFGGLAGIIGITRTERSNVIPGVAIATALMPPLCTAGYGLAVHSLRYFLGAMYLFLINTYFICMTTIVVLLILKVPTKIQANKELRSKIKKRVTICTIIFILPSIVFGYNMVRQEMQESTVINEASSVTFSVESLTKKIQLLFPEVKEVKAGYLEEWSHESDTVENTLSILVYLNKSLSEERKGLLEKYLAIEDAFGQIIYIQ